MTIEAFADKVIFQLRRIQSVAQQTSGSVRSSGSTSVGASPSGQAAFAEQLKECLANNPSISDMIGHSIVKTIRGKGQLEFTR